jgi:hypothetical protein
MRRAFCACVAILLVAVAPASAQVDYHPTPPPEVSAASTAWYRDREPIPFAGHLYYPAGPVVFFDGERMVPSGRYRGVPLYEDMLLEPFSAIFVPIGGRQMQPYVRRRAAGVTPPGGFGAETRPYYPDLGGTAAAGRGAGAAARPGGRQSGQQRQSPTVELAPRFPSSPAASSPRGSALAGPPYWAGQAPLASPESAPWSGPVESVPPPERNLGIWIDYDGHRWHGNGEAVRLAGSDLIAIGEYDGFPVFAATPSNPPVIYIPSVPGMVAPYELVR